MTDRRAALAASLTLAALALIWGSPCVAQGPAPNKTIAPCVLAAPGAESWAVDFSPVAGAGGGEFWLTINVYHDEGCLSSHFLCKHGEADITGFMRRLGELGVGRADEAGAKLTVMSAGAGRLARRVTVEAEGLDSKHVPVISRPRTFLERLADLFSMN